MSSKSNRSKRKQIVENSSDKTCFQDSDVKQILGKALKFQRDNPQRFLNMKRVSVFVTFDGKSPLKYNKPVVAPLKNHIYGINNVVLLVNKKTNLDVMKKRFPNVTEIETLDGLKQKHKSTRNLKQWIDANSIKLIMDTSIVEHARTILGRGLDKSMYPLAYLLKKIKNEEELLSIANTTSATIRGSNVSLIVGTTDLDENVIRENIEYIFPIVLNSLESMNFNLRTIRLQITNGPAYAIKFNDQKGGESKLESIAASFFIGLKNLFRL